MPSTSEKQHRFMALIANNKDAAKKAGVKQSVGKDFMAADKGKKFAAGGTPAVGKGVTHHEKMAMPNSKLGNFMGMKGGGQVKKYASGGVIDRNDPDEAGERSIGHGEHAIQKRGHTKAKHFSKGGVAFTDITDKRMGVDRFTPKPRDKNAPEPRVVKADDEGDRVKKEMSGESLKKGGRVKRYARGGGIESRGKTRGRFI